MKYFLAAVVILGLVGVWYVMAGPGSVGTGAENSTNTTQNGGLEPASGTEETEASARSVVTDGAYSVDASESIVNWAGKKPLIDGYTNSGTIEITEGTIDVSGQTATGEFIIDMDTLHVGLTAKKPGSEGKLEEHLKSDRWFNVPEFPTATFKITQVTPRADSAATFTYDVTGDLTMKGQTHEITFPATIYTAADGKLHTEASTEIDRTQWGITSGSKNFFDNLADNVIDDMVALSFDLVAVQN